MRGASAQAGTIVGDTHEGGVLDESIRRVSCARVTKSTRLLVKSRLGALKPELERHFQVRLTGYDGPQFLIYGPQTFYKWHQDTGPDSASEMLERRVSVVIFLNASPPDSGEAYSGGALRLHGLLTGPIWEQCAFPLEPTCGLLIAFRSTVVHEVEPITSGQRFSIVAWFTDGSTSET
jgi:predicted 2-oxoglutarate/Fe(II)-dependent dioxygenase YbiX